MPEREIQKHVYTYARPWMSEILMSAIWVSFLIRKVKRGCFSCIFFEESTWVVGRGRQASLRGTHYAHTERTITNESMTSRYIFDYVGDPIFKTKFWMSQTIFCLHDINKLENFEKNVVGD